MTEQTAEQTGDDTRQTGLADGGLASERLPKDDEPGGGSTPRDDGDDGPVELGDRTDGTGAPGANQAKAEPIAPTQGHRDPSAPLVPPLLADMNVGAADPQRPSLEPVTSPLVPGPTDAGPADAPRRLSAPGAPPSELRPTPSAGSSTGTDAGPATPRAGTAGESHRAPGMQGQASPAEQVETDVDASAAGMVRDTGRAAGADTADVQVPSATPSPGTSEEHGVVQGARIPRSD